MSVSVGDTHACAVTRAGMVRCCGSNTQGELGDGTRESRALPVEVRGLEGAVTVAAGDRFTCALRVDGSVACWGLNDQFQLTSAAGAMTSSASPVPIFGVLGAKALSVRGASACAAMGREEGVRCWGDNHAGRLGSGSQEPSLRVPMPVRFPR